MHHPYRPCLAAYTTHFLYSSSSCCREAGDGRVPDGAHQAHGGHIPPLLSVSWPPEPGLSGASTRMPQVVHSCVSGKGPFKEAEAPDQTFSSESCERIRVEEYVPWGHWRTWPVTERTLCYCKDIWLHCHPIWEGRQSILPVPPRLYMRPPSTFASFTRAQGATMCFLLFILCVCILCV